MELGGRYTVDVCLESPKCIQMNPMDGWWWTPLVTWMWSTLPSLIVWAQHFAGGMSAIGSWAHLLKALGWHRSHFGSRYRYLLKALGWHRSHFGSRYTLGSSYKAGFFANCPRFDSSRAHVCVMMWQICLFPMPCNMKSLELSPTRERKRAAEKDTASL